MSASANPIEKTSEVGTCSRCPNENLGILIGYSFAQNACSCRSAHDLGAVGELAASRAPVLLAEVRRKATARWSPGARRRDVGAKRSGRRAGWRYASRNGTAPGRTLRLVRPPTRTKSSIDEPRIALRWRPAPARRVHANLSAAARRTGAAHTASTARGAAGCTRGATSGTATAAIPGRTRVSTGARRAACARIASATAARTRRSTTGSRRTARCLSVAVRRGVAARECRKGRREDDRTQQGDRERRSGFGRRHHVSLVDCLGALSVNHSRSARSDHSRRSRRYRARP
jgi:hypothetical protein